MAKKKEKHVKNCFLLNANLNETSFFSSLRFRSIIFISCSRREKFHFMIEFFWFLSPVRRKKSFARFKYFPKAEKKIR